MATPSGDRAHIVLVKDDVTYEIEIDLSVPRAEATLSLEMESKRQPDPTESWWEEFPTGNVTVELKAFGKQVKSERRKIELPTKSTCALWYYRYGPDYDLQDSEAEAARWAVVLEDGDEPALILGVQFADGRTIPADQWEALAEARTQARQEEANRPLPTPIPTHTMRDPFRGEEVEVEDDSPSWVGR